MLLKDLDPRLWAMPGRHGQGLLLRCPHCVAAGIENPAYLSVTFLNPVDGGEPHPAAEVARWNAAVYGAAGIKPGTLVVPSNIRWGRLGDSFETMTLVPSLDFSSSNHWHGFIRDGGIQ